MRQIVVWHKGKWYQNRSVDWHAICVNCAARYDDELCMTLAGDDFPLRCDSVESLETSEIFEEIVP